MFATINLPGSQHFEYYGPASKAECQEWLDRKKKQHQELHGGVWISTYSPARIISNKEARSWKYRDGSRVIHPDDDFRNLYEQDMAAFVEI